MKNIFKHLLVGACISSLLVHSITLEAHSSQSLTESVSVALHALKNNTVKLFYSKDLRAFLALALGVSVCFGICNGDIPLELCLNGDYWYPY